MLCIRAPFHQYTSTIGADPTGNDKPGTTTGPFGIKRCQLAEPIGFLFQAQVHASHDDAVGQRKMRHLQWRKQTRVCGMLTQSKSR